MAEYEDDYYNSHKKIDNNQFISEYLETTKDKTCWNIGCYLGSMLYIDIGGKCKRFFGKGKKDEVIVGTDTISIYDCYWEIWHNDELIIDAWTDNTIIKEKIQCIVNKQFIDVVINKNWIKFCFYDNYNLVCDFTNQNEVEDETDSILQLTSENGNEYEIKVFGNIFKRVEN